MTSNEKNPVIIESLTELATSLAEGERITYSDIFHSIELPLVAFEHCCSWSDETYTRNCIFENEKFELILLCWEKGQFTPIHDHGGEECWVKVVQGELREVIYKENAAGELNEVKSTISKAGEISYMVDFIGYHSLENLSDRRSMSLHLYAKPIRNCNIFDENSNKFVNKDLIYDTVVKGHKL